MAKIITVTASYSCRLSGVIDLSPKTWDDVEDWYIKWDTLHVKFEKETEWREFAINSDANDSIDWKRPLDADIYAGAHEYDDELDSYHYVY